MFSKSPKRLAVPEWVESIEITRTNRETGRPYSSPRIVVKADTDLLTDVDYGPIEILYSIERNGDVINVASHRIEERVFAMTSTASAQPFAHTVSELWDIDATLKRRHGSPLVDFPELDRVPDKPLSPSERVGYTLLAFISALAIGALIGIFTS